MNIDFLKQLLFSSRIDEVRILGKNKEIDGVVCNIAALVRYGRELRLIILAYDENFQNQIEENELYERYVKPPDMMTNRMKMKGKDSIKEVQPFNALKSIHIGDVEFEVRGWERRRLNDQEGEGILILSELLRNGWTAEGIDYQNLDMIFFQSIELGGDFDKIPDFGDTSLHFVKGNDIITHVAELPVTLTVDGEYHDKIWFKNKETGAESWVQINRVYLMDMWEEMEKTFSDPRLLEQMTKEELAAAKRDFEEKFEDICSKGMFYPAIEYECEENISLQFYTKSHLDSKTASKNGGIGFIIKPEKATGILGMRLKSSIIQEPVLSDTSVIEAELFQYFETVSLDDIVI